MFLKMFLILCKNLTLHIFINKVLIKKRAHSFVINIIFSVNHTVHDKLNGEF